MNTHGATTQQASTSLSEHTDGPGLLVAYTVDASLVGDRFSVSSLFDFGRDKKCRLTTTDPGASKKHFQIYPEKNTYFLKDLDSTNGTFVDGCRVQKRIELQNNAVVRAGETLFVFVENAHDIFLIESDEEFGIRGRFHAGTIIESLREAVLSGMHLLLSGESGSGKELAARAVSSLLEEHRGRAGFVAHNCAWYAGEEEAAVSLFGVTSGVFTGVTARGGIIEEAAGGVLFLDEVHNLPPRLQRTLLRLLEDGQYSRVGETEKRAADVAFVFASNEQGPTAGLAHDIYNRLWKVKVPSLLERVADIPALFLGFLKDDLAGRKIPHERVTPALMTDHFEILCLDGFASSNVRGLQETATRIATRVEMGGEPAQVINRVFHEQFSDNLVVLRMGGEEKSTDARASRYEKNRAVITKAILDVGGNLMQAERKLKEMGIKCSRRWLRHYASKWGIRSSE